MGRIDIESANNEALNRIINAQPVLTDIEYAKDIFPEMDSYTLFHAGPPITWDDMCGPMKGAVIGALRYEGVAKSEDEAIKLVKKGKAKFIPCHHMGVVGPMVGIVSRSMPLFVVKNETFGNFSYSPINEGIGKVMRFGANDDEVIERLSWIQRVLAPALRRGIAKSGGINLKVIISQAVIMGDEVHQRNIAATSLFFKSIIPNIIKGGVDNLTLYEVADFLAENDQFFLNLAMAAGKATMDPIKGLKGATIISAMARNGKDFGIKVAHMGEEWFTAPVNIPQGLYFPGYSAEDANPDLGDSAIVETMGLGGFAMASSPAVARFVGAGDLKDAIAYTNEMTEITFGSNPNFAIPNIGFKGTPTGIDVRKVLETGILPVINTGIAHKMPGIGQVGAGVVRAPMECFKKALSAFAKSLK